jgi:hypothetical protein
LFWAESRSKSVAAQQVDRGDRTKSICRRDESAAFRLQLLEQPQPVAGVALLSEDSVALPSVHSRVDASLARSAQFDTLT